MTKGYDAAFARPLGEVTNPGEPSISDEQEGLTKREYFAAMAMQGFLAARTRADFDAERAAINAVSYADALIEALNKGEM